MHLRKNQSGTGGWHVVCGEYVSPSDATWLVWEVDCPECMARARAEAREHMIGLRVIGAAARLSQFLSRAKVSGAARDQELLLAQMFALERKHKNAPISEAKFRGELFRAVVSAALRRRKLQFDLFSDEEE